MLSSTLPLELWKIDGNVNQCFTSVIRVHFTFGASSVAYTSCCAKFKISVLFSRDYHFGESMGDAPGSPAVGTAGGLSSAAMGGPIGCQASHGRAVQHGHEWGIPALWCRAQELHRNRLPLFSSDMHGCLWSMSDSGESAHISQDYP